MHERLGILITLLVNITFHIAQFHPIQEKPQDLVQGLTRYIYLPLVIKAMPSEMVEIPAGSFQMGCDLYFPLGCDQNDELPLHTVFLDKYYIDKTEVTNAQYAKCVASVICSPPKSISSYTRTWYYGNPIYANYPVIYINWYMAEIYCSWTGKRLPTEAEWEKAARGANDTRMFPWGNEMPNCELSNCDDDIAEVGSFPSGESPYGVMDMAGNVYEWVNDWWNFNYYSVSPSTNPPGPTSGVFKVSRGGGFSFGDPDLWWTQLVSTRYDGSPSSATIATGFRCADSE